MKHTVVVLRRANVSGALAFALLALVACGGKTSDAGSAVADSTAPKGGGSMPAVGGAPDASRHKVLFVGTSLTAGLGLDPDSAYPQLIQQKIDSAGLGFQVENAGVSGETSAGLVRRLDWLLQQNFDVIVLETGANDGLRGTPVEETRANIQKIITRIKATHPAGRVLLVQMEAPPNFGTQYTSGFHAMFPQVAKETGVELLPFLLDRVAGHADLNQADGIHPNNRGERMVAENVWNGLEPMLRDAQRAREGGSGGGGVGHEARR